MIDFARYSFSSTDRVPGEEPLPYVSAKRKFTFFWIIVLVHIALVVLPSIFMSVMNHINPPRYVMRVPIVESLPNDNPEMSPHPSPNRKKSTGTPDYGKPEQLSKIPDMPELLPEPQQPKPQPQPKVRPKPKKLEVVKVDGKRQEKLVEKKTMKKKKYLDVKDIKVSKIKVVRKTNPTRQSSKADEYKKRAALQAERNARIAKYMKEYAETGTKGGQGTPGGGGGPKGILAKREIQEYWDKVGDYLKQRWEQPSLSALGGANPKVIIRFKVDSSGRILSSKILYKSGIDVMDRSVRAVVENLRALPVPPVPMEFDVTMEIDR